MESVRQPVCLPFGSALLLEAWADRKPIDVIIRRRVRTPEDVDDVRSIFYLKLICVQESDVVGVTDRRRYIRRVAMNTALDFVRRKAFEQKMFTDDEALERMLDERASPEEAALAEERIAELERFVSTLSQQDRLIFEYRMKQERKRSWIARVMGIDERVVKTRLQEIGRGMRRRFGRE